MDKKNVVNEAAHKETEKLSMGLDPAVVAKAIDDEPECPGEMPEEMWQALKAIFFEDDREAATEAIRLTVRLTKQGIKERLGV